MFKKLSAIVLTLLLSLSLTGNVFAFSSGGSGTAGDPYQIRTCTQLQEMRDDLDAHYRLETSIVCSSMTSWEPVGFSAPFTGSLDGQSYGIYNLSYTGDGPAGVFGNTSGATITNLSIVSANIEPAGTGGALVGNATNTTISHVRVLNPSISSIYAIAGIVGIADNSTITDSSTYNTTITAPDFLSLGVMGGLIGLSTDSVILRSSAHGTIIGGNTGNNIGGIIGHSTRDTLTDSYSAASVSGRSNIGGLFGMSTSSSINRTYSSGAVTSVDSNAGGLMGYQGLSGLQDSFSTSVVTGVTNVGGAMGRVVGVGGGIFNINYDITRSGQTNCVGLDNSISIPTDCPGVNASSAAPNYYFNNSTNTPLDTWNFTNTWRMTSELPTLITTPDRANNVRVTLSASSIIVTWEESTDTGGAPITSYDIRFQKSDATTAPAVVSGLAPNSPSTYTISGLAPNTEYLVEIRGHNLRGPGLWTGFVSTTLASNSTGSSGSTAVTTSSLLNLAAIDAANETASETPLSSPGTSTSNKTSAASDATEESAQTQTINPILVAGIVIAVGAVGFLIIRLLVK